MQSNGFCSHFTDIERIHSTHQDDVASKCSVRLWFDICQAVCFAFKLEYQIMYSDQCDGDVSEKRGLLDSRYIWRFYNFI